MPLFPQEDASARSGGPDAAQRMFWTREGGTRRVILAFLAVIITGAIIDKVRDHFLLETHWKPLSAEIGGLSVVGTLDARGAYDRNMFRVVQANKEFRVELTDFGWRSIFDPKNGPIFTEEAGKAIKRACDVDDLTGYAMLEPFLVSGVQHVMGKPGWEHAVDPGGTIHVQDPVTGRTVNKGTLAVLLRRFAEGGGPDMPAPEGNDGGGSGTTHEVEHGMTIPADTLARTCPVALTGPEFNSSMLEEHPASLVGGKTWTLHLGLTPEGRSRFYQWSHDHTNEYLVFVLDHEVVAAGRVPETLDVSEWELGPLHDESAAKKLEAYVRRHSR